MNTLINIGSQLWFEGTYQGGTLNFRTDEDSDSLHFQVGISHASLAECYRLMSNTVIEWKIRDCSLTLIGDQEELRLHFCSLDRPDQSADHVLRGRELRAFRYALHALASRYTALLN
jgi:hypothetical protein